MPCSDGGHWAQDTRLAQFVSQLTTIKSQLVARHLITCTLHVGEVSSCAGGDQVHIKLTARDNFPINFSSLFTCTVLLWPSAPPPRLFSAQFCLKFLRKSVKSNRRLAYLSPRPRRRSAGGLPSKSILVNASQPVSLSACVCPIMAMACLVWRRLAQGSVCLDARSII